MKIHKLELLTTVTTLLLITLALLSPTVQAQTSPAKVSPVKTILSMNPGGKQQSTIAVENSGTSAAKFNALFDNFTVSDEETNEPKILDDPNFAYGIKTWLSGPSSISLAAGARADYTLTITVPADIKPGTYYGVVRFGVGGTNTSVGSLFFVNVGAITQQVSIEQIDTSGIHVDNLGQATGKFAVRLKNTGNGYTVPVLLLEVLNDQKKVIQKIDANNDRGGVLPNGTIRKFTADFSSKLEPNKTYSVRVTALAGDSKPVTMEKNFVEPPVNTASTSHPITTKKANKLPILAGAAILLLLAITAFVVMTKKHRKLTTMPVPAPLNAPGQPPFPAAPPAASGQSQTPSSLTPEDNSDNSSPRPQ